MTGPLHAPDWAALPTPVDDGAAAHLLGMCLPDIPLPATTGPPLCLSQLGGLTVVYVYPAMGAADGTVPDGWDAIPGARGCTPQSCAFRDHLADLQALGAEGVIGLSGQSPDFQAQAAARLHLPFPLVSDADGALTQAMGLPMFELHGQRYLQRMIWIVQNGRIVHLWYPVFPPDQSAALVQAWLRARGPAA